jgi:hypothetical protein
MAEISQELVERMAKALRERVHAYRHWDIDAPAYVEEIRAIVAELTEPVDPDLLIAREIVKATFSPNSPTVGETREEVDSGAWDTAQCVQTALAGIKRGRELAARP